MNGVIFGFGTVRRENTKENTRKSSVMGINHVPNHVGTVFLRFF